MPKFTITVQFPKSITWYKAKGPYIFHESEGKICKRETPHYDENNQCSSSEIYRHDINVTGLEALMQERILRNAVT